jgi:hypothetical protein
VIRVDRGRRPVRLRRSADLRPRARPVKRRAAAAGVDAPDGLERRLARPQARVDGQGAREERGVRRGKDRRSRRRRRHRVRGQEGRRLRAAAVLAGRSPAPTAARWAQLKKQAMDAGAATKYSALEAARRRPSSPRAACRSQQILGGGLKGALALAAAGEMDLADARRHRQRAEAVQAGRRPGHARRRRAGDRGEQHDRRRQDFARAHAGRRRREVRGPVVRRDRHDPRGARRGRRQGLRRGHVDEDGADADLVADRSRRRRRWTSTTSRSSTPAAR